MEKWLLISNCQTQGMANSLQMLCPDIAVDAIDVWQFGQETAQYNERFDDYDRVVVVAEAEATPGADFGRVRRLCRMPVVYFCGYHPDLVYVTAGEQLIGGPLGPYHSSIALAACRQGLSVGQTIELYKGHFFEACGFFDQWVPQRNGLQGFFAGFGLDIAPDVRRWTRAGVPFMYSVNHPRIECLFDIARTYLRSEGYRIVDTDVLPHDNLANGACFPVYPEIGEALGVRGSYGFKRSDQYRQIELEAFVTESFHAFAHHGGAHALGVRPEFAGTHDRIVALLQ